MTLQDRIHKLMQHGDFDPELVAAVLDLDVGDVHHALRDNAFAPTPLGDSGSPRVQRFPFDHNLEAVIGHDLFVLQPGDLLFYHLIMGGTAGISPDTWTSDLGANGSPGTLLMQLGTADGTAAIAQIDLGGAFDNDLGGGIGQIAAYTYDPYIADAGVPVTVQLRLVAPRSVLATDPPTLPLTVTEGVNDKWHTTIPGFTFVVSPGTYTTAEQVAAAMELSEDPGFSGLEAVRVDGGKLRIFAGPNGTDAAPRPGDEADNSDDFLAGAGFGASQSSALSDWPVVPLTGSATLVFMTLPSTAPEGSPPLG